MKSVVRLALIALCCGLRGLTSAAQAAAPSVDPMPQTVVFDHCSWDRPGVNPFMGELPAAVDGYRDIPPEVRARLKARMEKRDYDDLVSIRRDSIDGRGGFDYGNTISDMHFGTHQLCRSVTRSSWSPQMQERGLVYCESGQCILVPTVCRNVSRITRRGVGPDSAIAPPLLPAAPVEEAALPPIDWMGPSGAGVPAAAGAPLGGAVAEGAPPAFFYGPFAGPAIAAGGFFTTGPWPVDQSARVTIPTASDGGAAVALVPEPGTWAMVLLGLGALALAAHRRRTSGSLGS
jgi:hypothetical protein